MFHFDNMMPPDGRKSFTHLDKCSVISCFIDTATDQFLVAENPLTRSSIFKICIITEIQLEGGVDVPLPKTKKH